MKSINPSIKGAGINCIIIDDEPLARKGLKEYIADVDFLNLAGEFDNPVKATEILSRGDVQLLFLDIQMPRITGLEFFKTLQEQRFNGYCCIEREAGNQRLQDIRTARQYVENLKL